MIPNESMEALRDDAERLSNESVKADQKAHARLRSAVAKTYEILCSARSSPERAEELALLMDAAGVPQSKATAHPHIRLCKWTMPGRPRPPSLAISG